MLSFENCPAAVCSGCCPWKLPCWETAIHSIPGVGIISSLSYWIYTREKLKTLSSADAELIETPLFTTYLDGGVYNRLSIQKTNRLAICAINLFVSTGLVFASLYIWGNK